MGVTGRERHELIYAANAVLLISSFFEALGEELPQLSSMKLTDGNKLSLLPHGKIGKTKLVERLTYIQVPEPWNGSGFRETLRLEVRPALENMAVNCVEFLNGLSAWEALAARRPTLGNEIKAKVVDKALVKYRDGYLRLAGDIPEFQSWIAVGESAATRQQLRLSVEEIIQSQSSALAKLETLLERSITSNVGQKRAGLDGAVSEAQSSYLRRLNAAELVKPILAADFMTYAPHLRLPALADSYVTPNFKYVRKSRESRPSEEGWWAAVQPRSDLDLLLAAHLAAPISTGMPLLVLGHPGAGKSLLTRIIAARLPAETHTAVWVPLRRVDATTPIYVQIETALAETSHGRLSWSRLSEETGDRTIRVVLLDGLDELVQASGVSQSRYLHDVIAFQEREETVSGRPVAVIVTSRTVVADRVDIPHDMPIIKLEDFDAGQVRDWLRVWNSTNRSVELFRPLAIEMFDSLGSIASQPLLLLLLALYMADPEARDISALKSNADLYSALIDNFVKRDIGKEIEQQRRDLDMKRELVMRRRHLSVAAFAMFNRGRQHVSHNELRADLDALFGRGLAGRTDFDQGLDRAALTVGQFFFVHSPRGDAALDERLGQERTYEFLHATFGEYLIALEVMQLLDQFAELEATAFYNPSPYPNRFDDNLLRALLSHEPLSKRPPILNFVSELFAARAEDLQVWIPVVVKRAIQQFRDNSTWGTAYSESIDRSRNHRFGADNFERVAHYGANLVAILAAISPGGTAIREIAPPNVDVARWWRSMVRLWRASLDDDGWISLTKSLYSGPDSKTEESWTLPVTHIYGGQPPGYAEMVGAFFAEPAPSEAEAYLLGDRQLAAWITSGRISWYDNAVKNGPGTRAHHLLVGMHRISNDVRENKYIQIVDYAERGMLSLSTMELFAACLARDAAFLTEATSVRCLEVLGARYALTPSIIARCIVAHPPIIEKYKGNLWRLIRESQAEPHELREARVILSGLLVDSSAKSRRSSIEAALHALKGRAGKKR
ncbi:hypothetical protein JD76_02567 [Micromonospora endolithica]|nr:hypothetical protein JD76_02567 [Micromonospora endolithica]